MTKLCICQICNCGRHRCPHSPQKVISKSDQPCALTEYARKYIPHPLEMRQSMKPNEKPRGGEGPMEDKTTHRLDYIKHPFEKPYVRPSESYVQPEGNIDDLTNYNKDYTKKPISITKPIRRDLGRKEPGKFNGEPTYKSDYRKFSAELTKPIIRDQGYRPNSQPFKGQSNYTDDYIKYNVPPRQSMKPADKPNISEEPFTKDTGYRSDYTNKPIPPREVREKPAYKETKAPLDSITNYKSDYVPKDFQMTQSCKPDPRAYESSAPLNDETTQRVDYTAKPYSKPMVRQPDVYTTPEGTFDFNTTHNRDYTPKAITKTQLRRPEPRKSEPGKFDDGTNYKKDFRQWPLSQRPEYKNKGEYVPNDSRFEGLPTYTSDYIKYNEAPRQSMKPAANANLSDEPFANTTEYREDFTKKPIPEREKRETKKWAPSKAPFDSITNYRGDYVPKDIKLTQSCKPDANAYQSDAPLSDSTTFRTDFQKWPLSRPFVHEPDQYIKPEGAMEKDTTTRLAYTPKPIDRVPPRKPADRKSEPGKFQDQTTNREDFRKWGMGDRAVPKQRESYQPNNAPFQGTSNYTDDYIKHPMSLTHSLRPAQQGIHSDAPFESGTEYKQEYTGKYLPPCPAGVIESGGRAGFSFVEQDPSGHKWYQPAMQTSVVDLRPDTMTQANKQIAAVC